MRKCRNCGKPLPRDANPLLVYCCKACKQQYYRRKNNPHIDQKSKIPPSNGTGDPEIDRIIHMDIETTLRNTLLKDHLERRDEKVRREARLDAEKWKEERVLDPKLAQEVARFLAKKYQPS